MGMKYGEEGRVELQSQVEQVGLQPELGGQVDVAEERNNVDFMFLEIIDKEFHLRAHLFVRIPQRGGHLLDGEL